MSWHKPLNTPPDKAYYLLFIIYCPILGILFSDEKIEAQRR